jgi:hypothetical protein
MMARFSYAASTGGDCAAFLRFGPAFLAVQTSDNALISGQSTR